MEEQIDITQLKNFNINILNPSQIQFCPNPEIQPKAGALSLSQAIQLMRTSTDVTQWNTNREIIQNSVGQEAFLHCGYAQAIDGSGLIKRIGMVSSKASGVKVYKPFKAAKNSN